MFSLHTLGRHRHKIMQERSFRLDLNLEDEYCETAVIAIADSPLWILRMLTKFLFLCIHSNLLVHMMPSIELIVKLWAEWVGAAPLV